MSFTPKPTQPDFSHILTSLANSKLQQNNNALYQTIFQLIQTISRSRDLSQSDIVTAQVIIGNITDATIVTVNDETGTMRFSRRLVSGNNMSFDDSVANIRTIDNIDFHPFLLMARP